MGATQKERALILVKAFPQHSQKYEETVCCAGLTPDGKFVRLYPIRYRHLSKEKRFDRWDIVEYEAERPAMDHRPESRHVNEDTIRIVQVCDQMAEAQRVRLWGPHVSESFARLKEENEKASKSLGVICPNPGSIKFSFKKLSAAEAHERQSEFKQVSLIDSDPLAELIVEYEFRYRFTSGVTTHDMRIHDWEVQAAYLAYKRKYGTGALDVLKQEYEEHIPSRNLHFVMGTMQAHPRQFIIIGLLRSSVSPSDALRQQVLI